MQMQVILAFRMDAVGKACQEASGVILASFWKLSSLRYVVQPANQEYPVLAMLLDHSLPSYSEI